VYATRTALGDREGQLSRSQAIEQDRFRKLCRQVIDENADGWQQALPVRNKSRDRGIVGNPGR
jgi:hypothetical protein